VGRVIVAATAGVIALIIFIGVAAGGVLAAIFGGDSGGLACMASLTNPAATPAGLNAEQTRNAGIIIGVGQQMQIPVRGWVIAIATALQESNLINLGYLGAANDHDSLGLFQQRPSQGWGTPEQIMNPQYAAGAFYTALRRVPGWETLPLTVAAERVQRAQFGDAYAKWESKASTIVAAFTGGVVCDGGDGTTTGEGVPLPAGFALPAGTPAAVVTAIAWALQQVGTSYSYGGDCTNPHGADTSQHCDCSSLVQVAYRHAGVSLPRTTGEQVHAGTPVASVAELRAGDIVFTPGSGGTMSDPHHEALYMAGGLVVVAPHTGANVMVEKIANLGPLADIRRVVPN
jgi:cell wall-associated NlpC family hydrolase